MRERGVLEHRYGLKGEGPWSCEEIGRYYGVTAARIQQIDNHGAQEAVGSLRD